MGLSISTALIIWLGAAIVLGTIEIFTVGFFFLFFAVGALVAGLVSLFTDSVIIQTLVFIVVSMLLVFQARPILRKTLNIGDKPLKESNVAALIGAEVLVTETVGKYHGKVKVIHTGEIWTAYLAGAEENDTLQAGSAGTVSQVDGAKLAIVAPNNSSEI